jgi:hypothetical protein
MRPVLLACTLALLCAGAAFGANFTFSVVTASPLTLPAVTLNGNDQSQGFTVVSQVESSGSSGWKVQAAADAPASGPYTLPALQVTAASWSCASGCPVDPLPTGLTYPMTLSATPQTIYNAGVGTGRGKFDIASTFLVSYPAKTIAGTYTSTITLSGSAGP